MVDAAWSAAQSNETWIMPGDPACGIVELARRAIAMAHVAAAIHMAARATPVSDDPSQTSDGASTSRTTVAARPEIRP
jgi:hypothetical protein